jgi:hypothetical protein
MAEFMRFKHYSVTIGMCIRLWDKWEKEWTNSACFFPKNSNPQQLICDSKLTHGEGKKKEKN